MAKARRKLRRQLMKKAKKGYLTPGEREDLMQLDREVNKANRQAAAVGVPALATALAIASKSNMYQDWRFQKDLEEAIEKGFISVADDDEATPKEAPTDEATPKETPEGVSDTTPTEGSIDDQLRGIQEKNNKKFTRPDFVPSKRDEEEEDYFEKEALQIRREMDRYSNWPYTPGTEERLGDMSGEELAQMMAIRETGPYNLRPEEEDKYLDYLGLGQDQSKPRPTKMQRRMMRRGFDPVEGEFYSKESNPVMIGSPRPESRLKEPEMRTPPFSQMRPGQGEDIMDPNFGQMPQKTGGYTPFLSSLRNKFQKRLTGKR
jgi:hypothetical protein